MKKKKKQAVALRYNKDTDKAPVIVGTGQELMAEKIIEQARELGIPVYEDSKLAETMGALSLGTEIPQELYQVVAQILVFICRADMDYNKNRAPKAELKPPSEE